jgi:hypothetical protein
MGSGNKYDFVTEAGFEEYVSYLKEKGCSEQVIAEMTKDAWIYKISRVQTP